MNKYFDFYWENPLKTYNKVKKHFLPIKPKFQWSFGKARAAKIFEINSFDLIWKSKWDEPRHEYNPRICISLFNYIHLYVTFTLGKNSMDDMVYWEAILWWVYFGKSLQKAVKRSTGWQDYNKETGSYEDMKFNLLREPYQTMYENKELEDLYYESTT